MKTYFTATQDAGACIFWSYLDNRVKFLDNDNLKVNLNISLAIFNHLKDLIKNGPGLKMLVPGYSASIDDSETKEILVLKVYEDTTEFFLDSDQEVKVISTNISWKAFVKGIRSDKVRKENPWEQQV